MESYVRNQGRRKPASEKTVRTAPASSLLRVVLLACGLFGRNGRVGCPACGATEHAPRGTRRDAIRIADGRWRCSACGAGGRALDFGALFWFARPHSELDLSERIELDELIQGGKQRPRTENPRRSPVGFETVNNAGTVVRRGGAR